MTKKPKGTYVFDEVCGWPYAEPYGEVFVPAPKKPRKPRAKKPKGLKDTWCMPRTHEPRARNKLPLMEASVSVAGETSREPQPI